MRTLLLPVLLLAVSACASGPTPFVPMSAAGEYGYMSREAPGGRVVVSTVGRTRAEARSMARLRAAELAREAGESGFVVERTSCRDRSERVRPTGRQVTVEPADDGVEIGVSSGVGVVAQNLFRAGRVECDMFVVPGGPGHADYQSADTVIRELDPTVDRRTED